MSILTEYNVELHEKNLREEGKQEGKLEKAEADIYTIRQAALSGFITREQADVLIKQISVPED